MQTIKASAGSGKTFRLTVEYISNIIMAPKSYRNILAVTFTNKATAEMKERVLKELCGLAFDPNVEATPFFKEIYNSVDINLPHPQKVLLIQERAKQGVKSILHDYSKFSISTIDKFFQKILRSFMRELGLEGGYDISFDNDYVNEMAIDRLTDQAKEDKELWGRITKLVEENIANNRSSDIKKSLSELVRHISDKEFNREELLGRIELLSHSFALIREAYREIIDEILGCTSEIRKIIAQYNITQAQIPSKSKGFIASLKNIEQGNIAYSIGTQKTASGEGKWDKSVAADTQQIIIAKLQQLIGLIDSSKPFITTAKAVMSCDNGFLLLAQVASTLEQIGRERGSLLMSSSLKLLTTLTADNDVPFIYEKCGTTYSKFLIDEFQDTSVEQWQNFKPLVKDALSQGESRSSNVVLLGDIKQSIYGWRGGDWRLLGGEAQKDVAQESQPREQITLQTNYRSDSNIIAFNNALMRGYVDSVNCSLNNELEAGVEDGYINRTFAAATTDILLSAYSDVEQLIPPHKSEKKGYVDVSITDFKEKENLLKMVQVIEDVQDRGFSAGDIAILLRTKKEARAVADFIVDYCAKNSEKAAKYNFDFVSAEVLQLSNSNVIMFVVNVLKLSTFTKKERTRELFLHNAYLGRDRDGGVDPLDAQFFSSLELRQITQAFEAIVSHYNLGEQSENVAYLQALHQHIVEFATKKGGDKGDFIEWWESEGSGLNLFIPDTSSSITLVTVHKAKGLEFGVVIMPFLNWKNTPKTNALFWAKSENETFSMLGEILLRYSDSLRDSHFSQSYFAHRTQAVIESCNILYVALTRSRSELYLMLPVKPVKNDNGLVIKEQLFALSTSMIEAKPNGLQGYTFGKKVEVTHTPSPQSRLYAPSYNSYDYTQRIKIKQSLERYYQEDSCQSLSPRHYGVIMHRLFEDSNTLQQILLSLDQMFTDALINQEQRDQTHAALITAFQNPLIADWFDERWQVRAEHDILIPSNQSGGKFLTSRPDRVLISDNEVVVIDYKFGLPSPKHKKQVAQYVNLLKSMGYNRCCGYVWYILANTVEEVES